MKEKLTRNIVLKILSIILAAFLWLFITNVDDPMTSKSFTKEVEVLNTQAISSLGQVYDITENKTISFTATARRSVADKLTKYDFDVTADLSKLSDLNTVIINIKYVGSEEAVNISNGLNQVMSVNLEQKVEGRFMVNVEQKGEPADGYYVYEKNANTILRITGPKSKIESIQEVVATVDVTNYAGESFQTSEEPRVLDKNGEEIDTSNLQFSQSTIPVNVGVYKTKTVNLEIVTTGAPADGYIMSNLEYEPKTMVIAASDDILQTISSIEVKESIEGASDDVKKEIKLAEQLPDGVILVGNSQTVVVNISIDKPKTKTFSYLPEELEVKNLPEACTVNYLTTGLITVRLIGPAKEINSIDKDELKPYIDLAGYRPGIYSVKIRADLSDYTTIDNSPIVNIHIINH